MLTIEMLKQSASLTGLSDEQFSAIAEMSRNDENTVIGTRIGALHGQYDTDVLGITGIKKNDGEKSYDYVKRVLNDYKSQLTGHATIQAQLANAKNEIDNLKQKIAEGTGDESVKQQLKDAKNQVSQLQKQLNDNEAKHAESVKELQTQVKNVHVDYAFQAAISGLKFKAGITDGLQNILLSAAKAEILAKGTPDFVDNAQGQRVLVFRDKDGNVMNNPTNNLNPFTVSELLMQTSIKDAIDTGRQQTGGGTVPFTQTTSSTGSSLLDLSGAKTQLEADKMIESYLLGQGYTRDSTEFSEQSLKLRTDNSVSALPIR